MSVGRNRGVAGCCPNLFQCISGHRLPNLQVRGSRRAGYVLLGQWLLLGVARLPLVHVQYRFVLSKYRALVPKDS